MRISILGVTVNGKVSVNKKKWVSKITKDAIFFFLPTTYLESFDERVGRQKRKHPDDL